MSRRASLPARRATSPSPSPRSRWRWSPPAAPARRTTRGSARARAPRGDRRWPRRPSTRPRASRSSWTPRTCPTASPASATPRASASTRRPSRARSPWSSHGLSVDVDVIAIDGKVYAKSRHPDLPEADPADYGAPDPAELMATDGGFSRPARQHRRPRGGRHGPRRRQQRGDPHRVHRHGARRRWSPDVIPSASGDDFDATYTITDDGELREAELTGAFYAGRGRVTYTLDFDDYGTEKDITAP